MAHGGRYPQEPRERSVQAESPESTDLRGRGVHGSRLIQAELSLSQAVLRIGPRVGVVPLAEAPVRHFLGLTVPA